MAGLTALLETKRANFTSLAKYQSNLLATAAICKAAGTAVDDKLMATIIKNGLPYEPYCGFFRVERTEIIESNNCGLAKVLKRMVLCERSMAPPHTPQLCFC
jgi:hypothetical protein